MTLVGRVRSQAGERSIPRSRLPRGPWRNRTKEWVIRFRAEEQADRIDIYGAQRLRRRLGRGDREQFRIEYCEAGGLLRHAIVTHFPPEQWDGDLIGETVRYDADDRELRREPALLGRPLA